MKNVVCHAQYDQQVTQCFDTKSPIVFKALLLEPLIEHPSRAWHEERQSQGYLSPEIVKMEWVWSTAYPILRGMNFKRQWTLSPTHASLPSQTRWSSQFLGMCWMGAFFSIPTSETTYLLLTLWSIKMLRWQSYVRVNPNTFLDETNFNWWIHLANGRH